MDPAARRGHLIGPVDRLLLAFLASVAVLAGLFVPAPGRALLEIAGLSALILIADQIRSRSRWLDCIHAFLPLIVLSALLNLIGPVIEHLNRYRADVALAAIDAEWFGWVVAHWRNALGRPDWLTDAASLAYGVYYLLPGALGFALWKAGRREEFDRFALTLTAVLLASYAAYFIAPAIGPRVPDHLAQLELGGGRVSALLRAFLRSVEDNQLDAFPSGHTAVSLALLAGAWPAFPRLRPLLVATVAAIIFSTVYLSLHYMIDVLAGAALSLLVLAGTHAVRLTQSFRRLCTGFPARPEGIRDG